MRVWRLVLIQYLNSPSDEDNTGLRSQLEECSPRSQSKFWLVTSEVQTHPQSNKTALKRFVHTITPAVGRFWMWSRGQGRDCSIQAKLLHRHLTCCSLIFPVISTAESVFWEITLLPCWIYSQGKLQYFNTCSRSALWRHACSDLIMWMTTIIRCLRIVQVCKPRGAFL